MNMSLLGTFFLSVQKNSDAKYITTLILGLSNMIPGCAVLQDTQGLVLPIDGIVRCNESLNSWLILISGSVIS
jgi:Tfp pilus assembly protein PilN